MHLDELLTGLAQNKGSDLYFTAESPPLYRIDGATIPAFDHVLEAGDVESVIREVLSAKEQAQRTMGPIRGSSDTRRRLSRPTLR